VLVTECSSTTRLLANDTVSVSSVVGARAHWWRAPQLPAPGASRQALLCYGDNLVLLRHPIWETSSVTRACREIVPLRYLLLQGCYADALATAGVTDKAGVHTHWCVLGAPDVSALATARNQVRRDGCRTDALATARVIGMVGVHTHWCVLGEPGVSVLATARVRCVVLGATLMPLPLRGSSAWAGYTPAGVYEGGPVGVPVTGCQKKCFPIYESTPTALYCMAACHGPPLPETHPEYLAI
jgi:hypothetical protein